MATKIADIGKKIGGARKDFASTALTIEDLASMNELEREKYVTRDNIWDFDAREAVKSGMLHGTALWIRDFRRNFTRPVIAKKLSDANSERNKAYNEKLARENLNNINVFINFVNAVKSAFADVKTKKDLYLAIKKMHDEDVLSQVNFASIEFSDFNAQRAEFKRWSTIRSTINYESYNYVIDAISNWNHINTKMDENPTFGELKLFAAREKKTEKLDAPIKPERPHLDGLVSTNLTAGNNEDFLTKFKFSGIEYGNWVSGKEREIVMNHALTAFSDLALALGIQKSEISLRGELSIAFGSRGTAKAMAHYETARKAMALTRLKGAGSIAHEYAHALDNFMGEKLTAVPDTYLTEQNVSAVSKSELAKSYLALQESMLHQYNFEKAAQEVGAKINLISECNVSWFVNDLKNANTELSSEARRELESLVRRVVMEAGDDIKQAIANIKLPENSSDEFDNLPEQLSKIKLTSKALFARVHKACEPYLNGIEVSPRKKSINAVESNLGILMNQNAVPYFYATHQIKKRSVQQDSEFVTQAKKLDEGKKDYFSTKIELFARAFEQYVFYRLKDAGIQSEYLVHSVESDRYEGKNYLANPYPSETERLVLAPLFDAFIEKVKTTFDFAQTAGLNIADSQVLGGSPMLDKSAGKKFFNYAEQADIKFSFS